MSAGEAALDISYLANAVDKVGQNCTVLLKQRYARTQRWNHIRSGMHNHWRPCRNGMICSERLAEKMSYAVVLWMD